MRISDWSSDVCSSDLGSAPAGGQLPFGLQRCPTEMTLASAPEDWYRDEPVYGGNSMPVEEVRAWAVDPPGFEGIWIDRAHNGWVSVAFSEGAEERQADLAKQFPGVGVVAVPVAWDGKWGGWGTGVVGLV